MHQKNNTRFWDRLASEPSGKPLSASSQKLVDLSQEFIKETDAVLDIGCGTGAITQQLSLHAKTTLGIDSSSRSIQMAKDHFPENPKLHFECKNVGSVKGTFQAITAFNLLHFIDDLPHFLHSIDQLLDSNGVFISSTPCLGEKNKWLSSPLKLLEKLKLFPRMQFYSRYELSNGLNHANFKVKKNTDIGSTPELFVVLNKSNI